ncbi:MAG TPA: NADAR family protein [Verrucomicrobiota bacterium]|nr:NADAR family protein [Verrucomicrobiota bacterium]HNU51257.1 NADAR family protein [Verrucomicrobiota bacterium]
MNTVTSETSVRTHVNDNHECDTSQSTLDLEYIKEITSYRIDGSAWFRSSTDPRWELHNMVGKMPIFWPLTRDPANRWGSSEALFQASQYTSDAQCLPASAAPGRNPFVRERIRQTSSPLWAKRTQKCAIAKGLVRKDWEAEDVQIKSMLWVLELKLFWNPETFGQVLAATGDRPIIELLNPKRKRDFFWGAVDDCAGGCRGCNVLGKLLMDVRSRLESVKRGEFTFPGGFLLP